MKTIETTVYSFDELSEPAKEKARDWYREGALDYDWWESTYEDAANIGLEITGFDLDRNRHATGEFSKGEREVCTLILINHGENSETFKTALEYSAKLNLLDLSDDERDEIAAEFLKSLLEDYSIILQHECEWLLADEQVDESIRANEYEFCEDGSRF